MAWFVVCMFAPPVAKVKNTKELKTRRVVLTPTVDSRVLQSAIAAAKTPYTPSENSLVQSMISYSHLFAYSCLHFSLWKDLMKVVAHDVGE